nr:leukocyte receptor cluster member 1 homolog [Leptinotarsa decemlineata]
MNILPKKRWHVRTRENIARVRRDEAAAAEQEKIRQDRIKLAEKEARRALLLERSRKFSQIDTHEPEKEQESVVNQHVNLFEDLQRGTEETKQTNTEHDKEKKEEREKYEKQIGYLTYLGQDTNEALGKKSWYDVAPDRSDVKGETNLKSKIREDPLQVMHRCTALGKNSKSNSDSDLQQSRLLCESSTRTKEQARKGIKRKHQSESLESHTSDEKMKTLELLRAKRLKREAEEKIKTEMLLLKLKGGGKTKEQDRSSGIHSHKSRYNSQFNPELARQNYK